MYRRTLLFDHCQVPDTIFPRLNAACVGVSATAFFQLIFDQENREGKNVLVPPELPSYMPKAVIGHYYVLINWVNEPKLDWCIGTYMPEDQQLYRTYAVQLLLIL